MGRVNSVCAANVAQCGPSQDQFACNISSGNPPACIPRSYVCDGFRDCFGGEDESNTVSITMMNYVIVDFRVE